MTRYQKIVLISAVILLTTACAKKETTSNHPQLANPASQYCIDVGGKSELIKNEQGWYGLCHLPDGTSIDEWQLYRSKHQ